MSSPALPNGPQGAGQRGQAKVQQQLMLVPGLAGGQCLLAEEEHAGCSHALLEDMGSCSPLPHAPSRGWYSADVHGRSGREPSLLPGASSAALSLGWSPNLCLALQVLWKGLSPMLCRVLDGVCCW